MTLKRRLHKRRTLCSIQIQCITVLPGTKPLVAVCFLEDSEGKGQDPTVAMCYVQEKQGPFVTNCCLDFPGWDPGQSQKGSTVGQDRDPADAAQLLDDDTGTEDSVSGTLAGRERLHCQTHH